MGPESGRRRGPPAPRQPRVRPAVSEMTKTFTCPSDPIPPTATARAVPKARPEVDENRTKAALLLAGCNLDVRVPEEPCFLSRPIPVEVFLLKDGELQHACNIPLQVWIEEEFQASVRGDSSSGVSVICDGKVTPDGSDPVITDGVVKFNVVAEERAIHGNKVRIRVCTDGGAGADSMEARRLSGRSHEFTLHKYMLTLAPQSEEPFYKDEGGKSKCMELHVSLLDESTGRGASAAGTWAGSRGGTGSGGGGVNGGGGGLPPAGVPLSVTLLYENGDVPYQQNILTISPESDLITDKRGRAKIRFRIEEVSKSHRGQRFRLLISADTKESPTLGNVAPVKSDPVLVLSKRKPLGKQQQANSKRQLGKVQHSPAQSSSSTSSNGSLLSANAANGSTPRSSNGAAPSQSPHHHPRATPTRVTPSSKRGRRTVNGGVGTPTGVGTPISGSCLDDAAIDEEGAKTGTAEALAGLPSSTTGNLGLLLGLGTGLIGQEADTLDGWARRALALLQEKLQWVVVGFETDSDGTPNPQLPISRCPSCREYRDASNLEALHKEDCQVAAVINNFYVLPSTSSGIQRQDLDRLTLPRPDALSGRFMGRPADSSLDRSPKRLRASDGSSLEVQQHHPNQIQNQNQQQQSRGAGSSPVACPAVGFSNEKEAQRIAAHSSRITPESVSPAPAVNTPSSLFLTFPEPSTGAHESPHGTTSTSATSSTCAGSAEMAFQANTPSLGTHAVVGGSNGLGGQVSARKLRRGDELAGLELGAGWLVAETTRSDLTRLNTARCRVSHPSPRTNVGVSLGMTAPAAGGAGSQDKTPRGNSMGFWLEKFDDPPSVNNSGQTKNLSHDLASHGFDRTSREEASVYYVLGESMKLKGERRAGGDIFPAYNREGEFIGIFQEYFQSDLRAVLAYHSLSMATMAGIILPPAKELEEKLRDALMEKKGTAYSLCDFENMGDLKQRLLTERALHDVRHAISAFGVNGVTDPGGVYPKDLDTMVATAVSPDRYSSSDMFMDQVQLGTDRLMGPG